ncbi:MAG: serine/threonine-protein kinase [Gemmatimonadaceae bacterium]
MSPQINRVKRLAEGLPQRYAFRSLIGRGAAAYVILADDVERQSEVAVKIMRPEATTLLGEKRFRREIEILSGLAHPNILPFLDHGLTQEGSLYLVTPFVAGGTLRTRLLRDKTLVLNDAISVARDVGRALDYAHQNGLIHRDIKPANILLSDGRAIVGDFGISRASVVDKLAPITLSGISLGTPEYMSPEQIAGVGEVDGRTDQYALGCVVYEMLTGKPPFTGRTASVFISQQKEPPRPIREIKSSVPAVVDKAIMKALAKQRTSRFDSAGNFVTAMLAAYTGSV